MPLALRPVLLSPALALALATGAAHAQPPRPPERPPLREARRPPPPPIPGVARVELADQSGEVDLAGKIYFLEDPGATLTYADVRSPAVAERFQLAQTGELNLGFTTSAVWLRLDIATRPRLRPDWMLVFDYPLLDRIELYDSGIRTDEPRAVLGDHQPFSERLVPHRTFAIPLQIRPGDAARFYLRIVTESSMQVRPQLLSGERMFLTSDRREFLYGMSYGVFLLMALYNLFLFLGVRDYAYLAYVGNMLFAVGFLMALNGHAFEYLWPDSPAFANLVSPLFAALWLFFSALFARLFLAPRSYARRVARVLDALIALGVVTAGVAVLAGYQTAMRFASGSAAVNGVLLLACGVVVWARGNRSARFYTLGWAGIGIGVAILALSRFGLMPDNDVTRNAALVGALLEAVLLSLALSDRFRLVNEELESYSHELEGRVAERTRDLELANLELERLSHTDPLTGVANRRSFDEALQREAKRARRSGRPLSLLLFDVDHFKQFNDRHGHPAGDRCLSEIAAAAAAVCQRPSDLVARYGGEEFAVILTDTPPPGALAVAEAIRTTVADLELDGQGPEPHLTVSVGVAAALDGDAEQIASVVRRADAALYEAKQRGRNRVEVDTPETAASSDLP